LLPPNITPQLLNKKDKSVSIDKTIVHFFIDYLIWFAIICQLRIKSTSFFVLVNVGELFFGHYCQRLCFFSGALPKPRPVPDTKR